MTQDSPTLSTPSDLLAFASNLKAALLNDHPALAKDWTDLGAQYLNKLKITSSDTLNTANNNADLIEREIADGMDPRTFSSRMGASIVFLSRFESLKGSHLKEIPSDARAAVLRVLAMEMAVHPKFYSILDYKPESRSNPELATTILENAEQLRIAAENLNSGSSAADRRKAGQTAADANDLSKEQGNNQGLAENTTPEALDKFQSAQNTAQSKLDGQAQNNDATNPNRVYSAPATIILLKAIVNAVRRLLRWILHGLARILGKQVKDDPEVAQAAARQRQQDIEQGIRPSPAPKNAGPAANDNAKPQVQPQPSAFPQPHTMQEAHEQDIQAATDTYRTPNPADPTVTDVPFREVPSQGHNRKPPRL